MTTVELTSETNESEVVWTDYLTAACAAGVGGTIEERHGCGEMRNLRTQYRVQGFDSTQTGVRVRTIYDDGTTGSDFWIEAEHRTPDDGDRWNTVEVGPGGPFIPRPTFFEWFSSMTTGQRFWASGSEDAKLEYVFWGILIKDVRAEDLSAPNNQEAVFYHIADGTRIVYGPNILGDRVPNGWHVSVDDDGIQRVIDPFTLKIMTQNEAAISVQEHNFRKRAEAVEEARKYLDDLLTLNDKINQYAEDQGMCGDYERRIYGWNPDLVSDFKLQGRLRNHSVRVRVPALSEYDLYVTVEARSPEQAYANVTTLTPADLLRLLLNDGNNFNNLRNEAAVVFRDQSSDTSAHSTTEVEELPLFQAPPF